MKIKIMYPNDRGRIELTKDELEKLLNESYSEGYSDGCSRYYSISTPSQPYITYCNSSINGLPTERPTITCDSDGTFTYHAEGISAIASGNASHASGIETFASATCMTENAAQTTTDKNNYAVGQTETIEICNVNGIGVVKTNEV
jgi:hypothetical protein